MPKLIGIPRATEYKIDGAKLRDFFEKEFVELLKSLIGNVKFEHICLVKLGEKGEVVDRFIIGHTGSKEEKNSVLTVGARTPEACEKILDVVMKFLREKQKD